MLHQYHGYSFHQLTFVILHIRDELINGADDEPLIVGTATRPAQHALSNDPVVIWVKAFIHMIGALGVSPG